MLRQEKIREIRKQRAMTLADLAKKTGLSTGLLSQIERGLVDPTVGNFWKICNALDVPFHYFFPGNKENRVVIRKGEHRLLELSHAKVRYHELIPNMSDKQQFLLVEIQPGETSDVELISHTGQECGYVIQGEMKIALGEEEIYLKEGDSIHFQSTTPHRYMNTGNITAISLWIMNNNT